METTYDSIIEQITQSIFSTMLNKDLVRVDEPTLADRDSLLATVQITGGWMGSVVLAFSPDIARTSAAAMLQVSDQGVTDADKQDVAAELARYVLAWHLLLSPETKPCHAVPPSNDAKVNAKEEALPSTTAAALPARPNTVVVDEAKAVEVHLGLQTAKPVSESQSRRLSTGLAHRAQSLGPESWTPHCQSSTYSWFYHTIARRIAHLILWLVSNKPAFAVRSVIGLPCHP